MTSVTVEMSNSIRRASFNTEDGDRCAVVAIGHLIYMQRACGFLGGPGEWRVEYLFIFSCLSFSIPQPLHPHPTMMP